MRSDEPARSREARPRGRRSAEVRRARMLLAAHVGWLGGYPEACAARRGAVAWRAAGASEAAPVDRATLAATTRALHELHRDYAHVLGEVVGDVAPWQRGVAAAIGALKAAVHDGVAPPPLWDAYPAAVRAAAARLGEAQPALAELLRAVSWARLGRPREAAADLRWFAANADAVAAMGIERAIAVRRVAEADGDARAAPLVGLLADPALAEVIANAGDHVERVIGWLGSGHKPPGMKPPPVGRALVELADWIAAAERPMRRAGLRVLALVDLPALIGRWRGWWEEVDREKGRAARARSRGEAGHRELGSALAMLRGLRGQAPPAIGRDLRSLVQRTASATDDDLDLIEAVRDAPGAPPPLALLDHLASWLEDEPAVVVARRAALTGYLAAHRDEDAGDWLAPVVAMISGQLWAWRLEQLLPRAADWRRFRDGLIGIGRGDLAPLHRDEVLGFAAIVGGSASAEDAIARLRALGDRRRTLESTAAQIAAVVSELPGASRDERARTFARVAGLVRERTLRDGDDEGDDPEAILALVRDAAPTARPVLVTVIEDPSRERLRDAAEVLRTARALRGRPPRLEAPAPAVPAWARAAPPALRPALAHADAAGLGDTARRRLDELLGDPARLATELAAIDARLPGATGERRTRLAARRANLAARIAAPPAPRPARVAKLAAELTRAAELAGFDRWRAALDAHLAAALPRSLGVEAGAVPWLLAPEHRALIRGLARLDGAGRALALRVLAARAAPPPWDLRDAPPNRAFLAGLAAHGVDATPWLDGIGAHRTGELVLALEDDPLEVLHMGRHFDTCLAPGAINFYSAVVNAADINKRVVYGRVDGKVVGRCLLALTDAGSIVTFHPYRHAPGFEATVREFVAALAREMGTQVVAGGAIRPLLHTRWYDDGARDLTGRFDFLADGSPFRRALSELDPGALVAELTARFAPLPLGGYVLGLVLRLEEVAARPDLVVPLAPQLAAAPDLPIEHRLRACDLLAAAGRHDLVDPRLPDLLERALRQAWRTDRWTPPGMLERLAAAAPSRALAFLRTLRPRRGDDHHQEGEHQLAAAVALERLRRPRQALARYRQALPLLHGDELARCRARIAELAIGLRSRG